MENLVDTFEQLKETYKNKKVFLTGHTGFKGSWMLKVLSMVGAEVKGYALNPNTSDDLFNLIKGDQLCHSVIGDLRDRKRLISEILEFQPDFVFHLAAQPLVRLSYEIPSETFEINAIGTANVLDGIRSLAKKCNVILITTDKVYQNNEWVHPYRESDRLGGFDPYSASKACTELVIDSYKNSFFNPKNYSIHQKSLAIGRAGNVIGGGDWSKDRLVPDIARALSKNEVIKIRNPKSVRPWQHVLEPVVAYLFLGMKIEENPIEYGQAYNFGPYAEDAIPVEDMLNLSINAWGNGSYLLDDIEGHPHEAGLLKLDISKAIAHLNWKPKLNAAVAVKTTINWYREFTINPLEMNDFTARQIMTYLNE